MSDKQRKLRIDISPIADAMRGIDLSGLEAGLRLLGEQFVSCRTSIREWIISAALRSLYNDFARRLASRRGHEMVYGDDAAKQRLRDESVAEYEAERAKGTRKELALQRVADRMTERHGPRKYRGRFVQRSPRAIRRAVERKLGRPIP